MEKEKCLNSQFKVKGYLELIRKSRPNGRYIHLARNVETVLYLLEKSGNGITPEYEEQVKKLIRDLYQEDNS